MKLYTEEQLQEAYYEGWNKGRNYAPINDDEFISNLKPIELTSDDEKDGLYNHIGNTNKMKTAVDLIEKWFKDKLDKDFPILTKWIFEQAKQMEKEQIIDAILNNQNGLLRRKTIIEAEQYYNEIYNK